MFQSPIKVSTLLLLFSIFCNNIFAQTNTTSSPLSERENNPYSKFGIGELWNGNSAELQGIGNITSAFAHPFEINSDNPASYAFLQRTTFEGGLTASSRTIDGSGLTYKTGTTSFNYLNIGVPVGKNGGLCFGLKPFSKVYYSLVDTLFNSTIGNVERYYAGEGSINYAFIGGAYKHKGLSFGANIGYLFGTIQSNSIVFPIDTGTTNSKSYIAGFDNFTRLGGIYWKVGILYEKVLHDTDYTIRFGGTFTLTQNLLERRNSFQISSYNLGDTNVHDTAYNSGELQGILKMPMAYSLGVMLSKTDLWKIGVDYTATNWNNYSSKPDTAMNLNIGKTAYKISIGGEYAPIPEKIHKHFNRMSYRFGLYYGSDYVSIQNTPLPVYGVTVGSSLHFKATRFSWVNLHGSLDIGRIGTNQNNLVQQTYARLTLGLSFNDKWFIPRKYD